VIGAFGCGNYVIGAVIFLVLIAIQYVDQSRRSASAKSQRDSPRMPCPAGKCRSTAI
jgi:hypothetical protein